MHHYTTPYYTTLHYTTPHYTALHYTTLPYTTLHYTKQQNITWIDTSTHGIWSRHVIIIHVIENINISSTSLDIIRCKDVVQPIYRASVLRSRERCLLCMRMLTWPRITTKAWGIQKWVVEIHVTLADNILKLIFEERNVLHDLSSLASHCASFICGSHVVIKTICDDVSCIWKKRPKLCLQLDLRLWSMREYVYSYVKAI